MGTKIYEETVIIDKVLEQKLTAVYVAHLQVYNDCVRMLRENPSMDFNQLREHVRNELLKHNPHGYIEECLLNEVYYMEKRFREGASVARGLTGVNYLTFRISNYSDGKLCYDPLGLTIGLRGFPGKMTLPSPLPDLGKNESVYLNIAYSGKRNMFKIFVFK